MLKGTLKRKIIIFFAAAAIIAAAFVGCKSAPASSPIDFSKIYKVVFKDDFSAHDKGALSREPWSVGRVSGGATAEIKKTRGVGNGQRIAAR